MKALLIKIALGSLLVAFIVWRAVSWYNHQIHDAEARGETRAYAAVEHKALLVKQKADAAADKLRSQNNAIVGDIKSAFGALRVRGPGAASYSAICPEVSSGHSQPASGPGSTAVPGVPGDEGLVVLPFSILVDFFQAHDIYRAEVITRRENDRQQAEIIAAEQK